MTTAIDSSARSNGDGFMFHDKTVSDGQPIEREIGLDDFPSPEVLWWKMHFRDRGFLVCIMSCGCLALGGIAIDLIHMVGG